jgi:hypothetical protein
VTVFSMARLSHTTVSLSMVSGPSLCVLSMSQASRILILFPSNAQSWTVGVWALGVTLLEGVGAQHPMGSSVSGDGWGSRCSRSMEVKVFCNGHRALTSDSGLWSSRGFPPVVAFGPKPPNDFLRGLVRQTSWHHSWLGGTSSPSANLGCW